MRGILADINVIAQAKALLSIWTSDTWRDFWDGLELAVVSFPTLELPYNASDALIWRTCQREGLVLIYRQPERRWFRFLRGDNPQREPARQLARDHDRGRRSCSPDVTARRKPARR
jgi:hypothetical protein